MAKTAFVGALLINGTGAEPVKDSLVLVNDRKIEYAGPRKEFGGDYKKVDVSGKTIIPGLVDSHLHFSGNLTDDDSDWVLENVYGPGAAWGKSLLLRQYLLQKKRRQRK